MSLRYLFGPVDGRFSEQKLSGPRQSGHCRTFDWRGGADLPLTSQGSWEEMVSAAGFSPDFLVLFLQYQVIPEWLWEAPVPIVALAGDWNLLWHHYRRCLWRADRVITDRTGVETLAAEGMTHVRPGVLYGLGRSDLDAGPRRQDRDLDIVFVGNFHAAIHRERLAWLERIAQLAKSWNVRITTGVFGDAYRDLLARARIVVNRGIRGEANHRTFEALATGALLFQEASNAEVQDLLSPADCVFYEDNELESRLTYYLEHEAERRQIAEAGQRKAADFTFERFWENQLDALRAEWDQVRIAMTSRPHPERSSTLLGRVWQRVSSSFGSDGALHADVVAAIPSEPHSSPLVHALAFTSSAAAPAFQAQAVQEAWQRNPADVVAGMNLALVLERLGQPAFAVEQAQRTLAALDRLPTLPAAILDAVPYPGEFDELRVEWERAAWAHAGDRGAEEREKRVLIRWRLESLLARLTEDPIAAMRACALRPSLPSSHVLLGRLLRQSGRAHDALEPLRAALAINPFDREAARMLHETWGLAGRGDEQMRLVARRRLLSEAAEDLVPSEAWFAEPDRIPLDELPGRTFRIAWQGTQDRIHSLAIVNRQLCKRLALRGHQLSLLPPSAREAPADPIAVPQELRDAAGGDLADVEVHVRHQWPPDFTPPPSGHHVLIQPWEFGSLAAAWVEPILRTVDEIWVPSRFVRNSFLNSGIPADLVHVVPNGVDAALLEGGPPSIRLQTSKRYKFLFVGGTIERKGFDLLLKAYGQVFSDRDDVCLVVKDMGVGTFYQGQTAESDIAEFRRRAGAPELEYITAPLDDMQMAGLYAACDCLVHPFRGEGFGLPVAEAMACGLPVITTAFGPTLDFCDPDTTYLLPARAAPFGENRVGDMPTVGQPYLAQPDQDALRYYLRLAYENPEHGRAMGRRGREIIRDRFTWDHSVRMAERRLLELTRRPIRRVVRQPGRIDVAPGPQDKPRVSLCMIVRNEEANLPDCLRSVDGLCDEIVVVDTGSTDATRQLAQESGARVLDFPWVDSFAAARNESLKHATGDWIFWMDADDRVDDANRQALKNLFARLPNENVGYVMKCLCLPDPDTGTATVVDHIRLFRNQPQLRWKYRIHEQILGSIRQSGGTVVWSDIVIHHVGYQDRSLRQRKLERDLRLLNLENQEHPDDPFTLFNLGSVYLERKEIEPALDLLRRSLELSVSTDSIVRKLYSLISQCERQLGRNLDALKTCTEGRRHYPDDGELLFQESLARRELGDAAGAEACLLRLRGMQEGNHFASVDTGLRGYKALHNLAVICQDQRRWADAETHWKAALDEQPSYLPALHALGEIYLTQSRWPELDEVVSRLGHHPHGAVDSLLLSVRRHLALKEFSQARDFAQRAITLAPQAIWPRLILSRVLLEEGIDWDGAEQALRDVLKLDPANAEANRNLQAWLARRKSDTESTKR